MFYQWRPYVSVAQRKAQALREVNKLAKKGLDVRPVHIEGRKIAKTFWGKAWCDHLESFSDFSNRLPRGRTYVRNGSVCHLDIKKGEISAIVAGSEVYEVCIGITKLSKDKWRQIQIQCRGKIGSLLELLEGKISSGIMDVVSDRKKGLFPLPKEIELDCSCPDWAVMCKHVAAVLYGVGARLDESPELLFLLRGVDHEDLITAEADVSSVTAGKGNGRRLEEGELADVFGIDIVGGCGTEEEGREENQIRRQKRHGRRRQPRRAETKSGTKTATKKATKRRTPKKSVVTKKKQKTAAKKAGTAEAATTKKTVVKKKTSTKAARKTPRTKKALPKTTVTRRSTSKRKTRKKEVIPIHSAPSELPQTGVEMRALRESHGMNQSAFARFLGVSPASVKKWEDRADEPLHFQAKNPEGVTEGDCVRIVKWDILFFPSREVLRFTRASKKGCCLGRFRKSRMSPLSD